MSTNMPANQDKPGVRFTMPTARIYYFRAEQVKRRHQKNADFYRSILDAIERVKP